MFGKNKLSGTRPFNDYLVKEIFYTIQGEGPWAGQPSIFLRMAGCNLACWFCDTDFEGGTQYDLDGLVAALYEQISLYECNHVVITGGEPMLQEIGEIIEHDDMEDIYFQIETAGTVWPSSMDHVGNRDMPGSAVIVVSPKTPKLHPEIIEKASDFKYILKAGHTDPDDGLPIAHTQFLDRASRIARPPNCSWPRRVWVQPLDEGNFSSNAANLEETARVAMAFGYRVSLQMHKIIGVP